MLESLKNRVLEANLFLERNRLITLTWGNASAIDRPSGLVVIKPSGVSYAEMKAEDMVVVRLSDGNVVEGALNPSSDTPTHLVLYRAFPSIGGVIHTHSTFATSFAQAKAPIPALGTTHADHFLGEIPVTRSMTPEEIRSDYEANTGLVITELFEKCSIDPNEMPAVLVASHGVFNWGPTVEKAAENALVTERCAEMALYGKMLGSDMKPISDELLGKHYFRKHGKNAYYGQKEQK